MARNGSRIIKKDGYAAFFLNAGQFIGEFMKSIKLRHVVMNLALVFIVMLISGTFMLTGLRLRETNKAKNELVRYAQSIDEQIIKEYKTPSLFQTGFNETQSFSPEMRKIQGNILDANGKTFASTVYDEKTQYSQYLQYKNSAIISAMTGTPDFNLWKKDIDISGTNKDWIDYAYPVKDPDSGQVKFVIFTRMDVTSIVQSMESFTNTMVLTVILALFLTAILGYSFSSTLTEPIIVLTRGAKEMAQGKLNQEITVHSEDEIGQLTESFNYMAKELNQTMASMYGEKNKMEILLHNMTDGVLAYDSQGILIHANNATKELLGFNDIDSLSFKDMMERLKVEINDVNSLGKDSIKEITITLQDKFINASFAPYFNRHDRVSGLVIVLQDITRHKKLDNMRKEFVANVSHEIRTPLTTIKSYTETLLDGAIDQRDTAIDFLSTINSEADRMALLVVDLLELSRFDSKQLSFEFKETDLVELLSLCIKQNSLLAEKKEQTIIFDKPSKKLAVMIDPGRINQVFTNIISNAIKYSTEKAKIQIYCEETDKYYRVYIQDNGIGIPKEDLKRIFERFYRVDKARSRAMGGTGLGLAIAREIMEAHGGRITASSELNKGTTMILRFKKYVPGQEKDLEKIFKQDLAEDLS